MDNLTPTLTQQQLEENINALQQQKVDNSTIQTYVNNYQKGQNGTYVLKTQQQPTTATQPKTGFWQGVGNFATNALPAIGSTIGAIGGGLAGGAIASPTVLGIPAAAYAGAVGGAALGAAAGEAGKEAIQKKAISPKDIAVSGAEYGGLEAVAGPVLSLAGKGIEAVGQGIGEMFIPKSTAESAMLQTYKATTPLIDRIGAILGLGGKEAPGTAASTAFDKGLVGTEQMLGVGAQKAQTKLWDNLIDPALKQSDAKITMSDFFKQAEDKITTETNDPTRKGVLLNALNSIKDDFKGVEDISLKQLQKYKEGWAEFVPEKAYKGQPIAGAVNDVRNTLAGMARQTIYGELGSNVKQAYIDYTNLYGIKQLGIQAGTGITNVIKGGTGTSIKNILEQTTIPIGTLGGQIIYKVGQGVELLGAPGARIVRNLLYGGILPKTSSPAGQSQDMSQSSANQQNNTPATPPPTQ